MKLVKYACSFLIACGLLTAACSTTDATSTRICQLTGSEDRSTPGRPTGMQLGGITGGVTGTDIGWPFEHRGSLNFLFGDTRDFNPDLCEPDICDTTQPTVPDGVLRWPNRGAYESWLAFHGNSAENMATAPLDFDPEQCIPLSVVTELRAGTFAHAVSSTNVEAAIQLSAPAVAASPQDRFVVALDSRILVVTDDRRVFAHKVVGNTVGFARQLGTSRLRAAASGSFLIRPGSELARAHRIRRPRRCRRSTRHEPRSVRSARRSSHRRQPSGQVGRLAGKSRHRDHDARGSLGARDRRQRHWQSVSPQQSVGPSGRGQSSGQTCPRRRNTDPRHY